VLICASGGAGGEAQRFAADFLGRFKRTDRPGTSRDLVEPGFRLLRIVLGGTGGRWNCSSVEVEAFGQAGDILLGISPLGRSFGLIRAFGMARRLGLRCIAIAGGTGGELNQLSDLCVLVPSSNAQHIQEAQMVIVHLLCELVEERFGFRRRLEDQRPVSRTVVKLPRLHPQARTGPFRPSKAVS
jgi:Phosphoheptose isomerase